MRLILVAVLSISIPIAEQTEGAGCVFAILLVEICATGLYILDHSFLIIVGIGLRVTIFFFCCGLIVDR